MATKNDLKRVVNAASMWSNPLRSLTSSRIEQMIDQYRRGQDAKLQVCFDEIEKVSPIFSVCISKRTAGIIGRNWKITPIDGSEKARAQADAVQKMFDRSDTMNIDGLTDAIRHLALAPFKGRSVVKPYFNGDGTLCFKCIKAYHTLENSGRLYWNPEIDQSVNFVDDTWKGLQEITEDEVCWTRYERPIDIPGFSIYLRQLVGETKWAEFLERYGIPQIVLTAPDGTSDENLGQFNQRAIQLFLGGSGTLPYGTGIKDVNLAARSQDPFSEFCDHQMRMICLLAVGSTASILGDVGSGLGSDVATKQDDQFQSFVTEDCKKISNSLTRCAVRKCVCRLFGDDAEILCRFSYTEDSFIRPDEYIDMALKLKGIGVGIDIAELKKVTGLTFIRGVEKDLWQPEQQE